jgi:hypothetical protein
VGNSHVFVVLGVRVRMLTPINVCHFNANFAWTSKIFILVKIIYFWMFMQKWSLCSHRSFGLTFWQNVIFKELFPYMWFKIWGTLHAPKARWLTYCGMRILAWELVEILEYWVVPVWKVIQTFFSFSRWIWLPKGLFLRDKTRCFLVRHFLQLL